MNYDELGDAIDAAILSLAVNAAFVWAVAQALGWRL